MLYHPHTQKTLKPKPQNYKRLRIERTLLECQGREGVLFSDIKIKHFASIKGI